MAEGKTALAQTACSVVKREDSNISFISESKLDFMISKNIELFLKSGFFLGALTIPYIWV